MREKRSSHFHLARAVKDGCGREGVMREQLPARRRNGNAFTAAMIAWQQVTGGERCAEIVENAAASLHFFLRKRTDIP